GLNPRSAHRQDGLHLVEALLGRIACLKPRRSLQLSDHRTKRAVEVVRRALITQARVRLAGAALSERCRKAGLANPRLARDQHDLSFAFPGPAWAFLLEIDLVLAAAEIG